jgi:RNA polymerase sigma factor (TIGR02999 family)
VACGGQRTRIAPAPGWSRRPDERNRTLSPDSPGPAATPGLVTQALRGVASGTSGAWDDLLRLVYDDLHRVAAAQMAFQPRAHTLQSTAVVHEAFLRLVGREGAFVDRRHFFAAAARAMRSILVDHARARRALKRGGSASRVGLERASRTQDPAEGLLAVHEALERLQAEDSFGARVVELRFFGGLSASEAAEVLSVSERTVQRAFEHVRTRLFREIEG